MVAAAHPVSHRCTSGDGDCLPERCRGWAVHAQCQVETARRLAGEIWLHRNGVITNSAYKKALPICPKKLLMIN